MVNQTNHQIYLKFLRIKSRKKLIYMYFNLKFESLYRALLPKEIYFVLKMAKAIQPS